MFVSRYRKFEPGDTPPSRDGDDVIVAGPANAAGATLSQRDFELASLFDGTRSAAAILEAARARLQRAITPSALEGFAATLGTLGVLRAGSHDPLPPPAQSDEELDVLGWSGGDAPVRPEPGALPPSTVPGSRSNPGLPGGLTNLVTSKRGQAAQLDIDLPPGPFVAFGRTLIPPVRSGTTLIAFLALLGAASIAIWGHRHAWLVQAREMFAHLYAGIAALVFSMVLTNLFSESARAAAVARYTHERARIGLVFGFLGAPQLFTISVGAAERAGRADRMRIVGSALIAVATVLFLSILTWFLTSRTLPEVARVSTMVTCWCLYYLVIRNNPITQRDGYFLLANAIGAIDLRQQAVMSILGFVRPWQTQQRTFSRVALLSYAACMVLYWIAIGCFIAMFAGAWLEAHFRGVGVLFLSVLMGAYMVKQYSRVAVDNNQLGVPKKSWRPSRNQLIALGVFAVLCVIPYPYAPSGDFEVLPHNRADVRALAPGDIREVLVKEGDLVKAGQAIAKLDTSAQRARVAASQAELAGLKADLALANKGARPEEIAVARQRVATARSAANTADAAAKRIATAYKGKGVTPQEYERAKGAADVAKQQVLEAERSLTLISSPVQKERIEAIEANIQRAEAELAYAQQDLAYGTITAPIDGRIVSSKLQFALGQYFARGDLLATIEDTKELIGEIKMPEEAIGDIAVDASASVKPWAYPGTSFGGHVKAIAPAAEAGEYGKIVRVQVVIEDPDNKLKTGMTGNAKVSAGWHLSIVVFTRAIARFLFVELWSWIP